MQIVFNEQAVFERGTKTGKILLDTGGIKNYDSLANFTV